ncbi:N-glycosylase/DNA lyase [Candidatus Woesearchaeota archaeon]|jgi:N-glycosylase/DNA lyase|nr:N-glycosylase/DNA lyase [Candidatus Woesearchaeota archaeon]MBT3536983.1 N-glycosylase/DNA lyase [Candidatus Woesearchaeota archaeon]MBT4697593.1 N-glycosylase/DNA lyase [Candidatus Woesearchaeota archaeon]MBT4717707.1 N-glycosylase/DNA lyase [Candidatus Woesearchaeota archaeon]MBT7106707.1 N-glycosylase/DNA lyase [Candidatus Woesearchaeota archaeon]
MRTLIKEINTLKLQPIKKVIDDRIKEFQKVGRKSSKELFKELCFCTLTANFNAERGIQIQKTINNGFLTFTEKKLAKELKKLGHRFPNARANYIHTNQKYKDNLKKTLSSHKSSYESREWLEKNIKGLGFKEASHFLRNIGYENLAIIDFHIINLLAKHNLTESTRTISKKKYIEIEIILSKIGEKTKLNLAELDLYLWYMETNKVLK